MTQITTEIQTGCTTCGAVGSTFKTYVTRGSDVVVQGVRLATCSNCLPPADPTTENGCDGRCKGTFATTIGTYHELRWRPMTKAGRAPSNRTYLGWACWDIACVDDWAERSWVAHDTTIEWAIYTVVDGVDID